MYGRKIEQDKYQSISSVKHWRIYTLVFFVILAAVAIIFRLYTLQVVAREDYRMIGERQYRNTKELIPERGEIYLKDDNELYPLAVNQEKQMAYATPQEIEDKNYAAEKISSILNLDRGLVEEKLADDNDLFEILKHKLSEEEASKIKELKIKGIYLAQEKFRYYPAQELASQTVGFVGSDGENYTGRYGVELFWDKMLKGAGGMLDQKRDAGGRWMSITDREIKPAENGAQLVLTIDHSVQYEVEKILKETIESHKADDGTIIAMNPKTGRILAMANFPSFNPNNYSEAENLGLFMNPAVNFTYECGSAFKIITAAIGIDEGRIEPDTTYVDTGAVHEAGYEIKNSDLKSYGKQTMTQVLEKSLNTGAIFIERSVGNKKFADGVKKFGFGEKTGIELPGEMPGNIRNLEELKRDIQFYTASFGQGIAVTPLQLLNGYAAIANGGKLMKPQIVEKIIYPDGREEETFPQEIRQVISEETAKKVGMILRSVVVNGHGKRANVPGYLVGGKTGTAQVAKSGEKGYEEGVTIGSFVGFAPVDDPQFAILVKIYNPKDVQWAESTAAPAFSKVMKFLLEYYKVQPTEEYEIK